MKSALECSENARRCEQAAGGTADLFSEKVLLATAAHWRTLAAVATARQYREKQDPWPPA